VAKECEISGNSERGFFGYLTECRGEGGGVGFLNSSGDGGKMVSKHISRDIGFFVEGTCNLEWLVCDGMIEL